MQDKDEHLELMDGMLVDLLHAKWNAFVKAKFYKQFFLFTFYFLISLVCFTLRPGPPLTKQETTNATFVSKINQTLDKTDAIPELDTFINDTMKIVNTSWQQPKQIELNSIHEWWSDLTKTCRLMNISSTEGQIRLSAEILMEFGAFLYILSALREASFLGGHMFIENLVCAIYHILNKGFFVIFSKIVLDDRTIKSNVLIFLYFNVNNAGFSVFVQR